MRDHLVALRGHLAGAVAALDAILAQNANDLSSGGPASNGERSSILGAVEKDDTFENNPSWRLSPSVKDLLGQYITQRTHEVTPQHLEITRLRLEAFGRWLGTAGWPTRGDVIRYRDHLLAGGAKVPTVNQHLSLLGAFFSWAAGRNGPPVDMSDLRLRKRRGERASSKRDVLTDEEYRRLSKALRCLPQDQPLKLGALFLTSVMAYTGARPEEIAQLGKSDLREVQGILCFDFTSTGEGQRHKNEASRRLVPVHPLLLGWGTPGKASMTGILASSDQWFSPDSQGRRAARCSRLVNETLRSLGITSPRKVLYSLRHTVATKLKHAGVEESLIAELLGHTNSSMTTGRYGKEYPVEHLAKAVELIKYS